MLPMAAIDGDLLQHFFDKYLLHVQHSGREQVLQGFGWKMLPGVFPTGKPLNMDVSYKVSDVSPACLASWLNAHVGKHDLTAQTGTAALLHGPAMQKSSAAL